jgi:DNA end-binding protein Ku
MRTFWKGQLRLALVIIPVRLVNALDRKEQIHFHQVDRQSRQRIRYEKVAPGVGEVSKEDIVYGYEIEPGNYVLLEEDELDNLKLESRHTIELVQFVENCDIDPLYFERPYYIVPDGEEAEEPYRVIRDALRSEQKIGIGQLTLRGREHLVALSPCGKGMMLETLRYENEIKDADKIFSDIGSGRLRQDLVNMAKDLIEQRASPFDAAAFRDHYAEALRQLVNSKLKGHKQVSVGEEEIEPPGGKVIDFTDALKRSLQKSGSARSREAEAPARRSRTRARARR